MVKQWLNSSILLLKCNIISVLFRYFLFFCFFLMRNSHFLIVSPDFVVKETSSLNHLEYFFNNFIIDYQWCYE